MFVLIAKYQFQIIYINEENSSHKISSEIIDHACDDSGKNLDNTEE